jgi:hypothetical protein
MVGKTKTGYYCVSFFGLTHEHPQVARVIYQYREGSATQPVDDLAGARRS